MPFGGLLTLGTVGVGEGLKAYNYYKSSQAEDKAQSALSDLAKQPYSKYFATPELMGYYSMARNGVANPLGLTGGEKTAYHNDVASNVGTMTRNAINTSGGGLSRFITNSLNPAIIAGSNNLVSQDAALKRQNKESSYARLGSAVSAIQGINDKNIEQELYRRMLKEQALGQSVLQQKGFQSNTLDSIGSDLIGGGLMMGMGGMDGGQAQPNKPYSYTNNTYNQGYQGFSSPTNGNPYNRWLNLK